MMSIIIVEHFKPLVTVQSRDLEVCIFSVATYWDIRNIPAGADDIPNATRMSMRLSQCSASEALFSWPPNAGNVDCSRSQ